MASFYGKPVEIEKLGPFLSRQGGWSFWNIATGEQLLNVEIRDGQFLLIDQNNRVRHSFILRSRRGQSFQFPWPSQVNFDPQLIGSKSNRNGHRYIEIQYKNNQNTSGHQIHRLNPIEVLHLAQDQQEFLDVP